MILRILTINIVAALIAMLGLAVGGQEFQITEIGVNGSGSTVIRHRANLDYYYILCRGTNATQIVSAVDMALGVPVEGQLQDDSRALSAAYFRARQVPITSPLDTDGDGIDDVWELRQAALNPLSAVDAQLASAGPGSQTWKQVYEAEQEADLAPLASFLTASSSVVANVTEAFVTVTFNRPFTGTLTYNSGGTAVPGMDFATLPGSVEVNGSSQNLPVRLLPTPFLEAERRIVLSLAQPPGNPPPYRIGAISTHELRIVEGNRGVYFGTLTTTHGYLLGTQALKVALRSGEADGRAFFDTSQCSFFDESFVVPVQFNVDGKPFEFSGIASGSVSSTTLQRQLDWTLRFSPTLAGPNDTLSAKFVLELSGLTASGQKFIAEGLLQLNRADN